MREGQSPNDLQGALALLGSKNPSLKENLAPAVLSLLLNTTLYELPLEGVLALAPVSPDSSSTDEHEFLQSLLVLETELSTITSEEQLNPLRVEILKRMPPSHPRRLSVLTTLGLGFQERFKTTGSLNDINNWVKSHEEAIKTAHNQHLDALVHLHNLEVALYSLYTQTGCLTDLAKACMVLTEIATMVSDSNPQKVDHLQRLVRYLFKMYYSTGNIQHLAAALTASQQAINCAPENYPLRANLFIGIGFVYLTRFQLSNSIDDLDGAISAKKEALKSLSTDHPNHAGLLDDIGVCYQRRFGNTGSMEDLNYAVDAHENAIIRISEANEGKEEYLSNAADALILRFNVSSSIDDLSNAIAKLEITVQLATSSDTRISYIRQLSNVLETRLSLLGSLEDLNSLIETLDLLTETTGAKTDGGCTFSRLALMLFNRFNSPRSADREDLNRAISTMSAAISAANDSEPQLQKSQYLMLLGNMLFSQFEMTDSVEDIDKTIAAYIESLALTPEDDPDRPARLSNFGDALRTRSELTGCLEDLEQAVISNQDAVKNTTDDDPERPQYLHNLGNSLLLKFQKVEVKNTSDLDSALEAFSRAVGLVPQNDRRYAMYVNGLSSALQEQAELNNSLELLDSAIEASELAITTLTDEKHRAAFLTNFAFALQARYKRTSSKADIDKAVKTLEDVVNVSVLEHHRLYGRSNNLANALYRRYELAGDPIDLDTAISYSMNATQTASDPEYPQYLNSHACFLRERFLRTGSQTDLSDAMAAVQAALSVKSDPSYHNTLALCYLAQFELTGVAADLASAVKNGRSGVDISSPTDTNRLMYINTLVGALDTRMRFLQTAVDLDEAVQLMEEVVKSVPSGRSERAKILLNYSSVLMWRFEALSLKDDLDSAIRMANEAAELTGSDNDPNHSVSQERLGNALTLRWKWYGFVEDLNTAIEAHGKAVSTTPAQHLNLSIRLNNLLNTISSRADWLGSLDDLEVCIKIAEAAVQATKPEHIAQATHTLNYGNAYYRFFERNESLDDLNSAIQQFKKAADSASIYLKSSCLNSLAIGLMARFAISFFANDIDNSIRALEEGINLMEETDVRRSTLYNNIGIALLSRFKRTQQLKDIKSALQASEDAVKLAPLDHPDRCSFLVNLGNSLEASSIFTGSTHDRERAIQAFEKAVDISHGHPSTRIDAAHKAAMLISDDLSRICQLLKLAVELLPLTSSRALKRGDQQYSLSKRSGLVSTAVASLVASEEYSTFDALRLLELGRGIIASLYIDLRSDINILETSYPELAQRYKNLRDLLDGPQTKTLNISTRRNSSRDFEVQGPRQLRLSNQFDQLLVEIRSLKGFESFLQGSLESESKWLARSGPIITFNIADSGSHAFVITYDRIRVLELPALRSTELMTKAILFLDVMERASLKNYSIAKETLRDILIWLWDKVVEPVLTEAGFHETPSNGMAWPRVWWVPSGWLSVLPIHAAGYHEAGSSRSAIDRVISIILSDC